MTIKTRSPKNTRRPLGHRNERGEGVISLAIGVLIMAALGVGMWKAFDGTMKTAQKNVDDEVTSIQPAP